MRLLLFSDNHWCANSSIVRSMGNKYSTRLENQILSLNWVEKLAVEKGCNRVICLGDFFDKPELNAMELTALKEVKWNSLPHTMLVGNHELGLNNLTFSSSHLFALNDNIQVISEPTSFNLGDCEVCLLPYVLEGNRKLLSDYFKERPCSKRIILSHNDIKGIQLGPYLTQTGFELEDIKHSCDLFINGHLHNGGKVCEGVINIGNLTGQNFSEDAFKYKHEVFILDTDTLKIEVYENPHAFNFYKVDYTTCQNPEDVEFKQTAIVSAKCFSKDLPKFKTLVNTNSNVLTSRFIVEQEIIKSEGAETLTVDHLQRFREYVLENIGSTEIVLKELDEVTK